MLQVIVPVHPVAVKVDDSPAQIVAGEANTTGDVKGLTVIVCDTVVLHGAVPQVTEYVVVDEGLTVILAVVAPLLHNILLEQPFTVIIDDSPAHIVDLVADIFITGFGVTVTVALADEVHEPLVHVAV